LLLLDTGLRRYDGLMDYLGSCHFVLFVDFCFSGSFVRIVKHRVELRCVPPCAG